jgi:exopolysaccharide biosynthesis polyprenyl glycosylphosphotransferase
MQKADCMSKGKMNSVFRKIILLFGDAMCLYFATIAAIFIENGQITLFKGDFHLRFLALLIVLMGVFFNIYGLFSLIRKRYTEVILNLIVAVINIFVVAMAVTFIFRDFEYSRVVIIYTACLSFILLVAWMYIMHQWEARNLPQLKILIAAEEAEQDKIKEKMAKTYGLTSSIIYTASSKKLHDLEAIINNNIDWVVIGESLSITQRENLLKFAKAKQKMIILVPTLYEICCRQMYLWQIDDLPTQRVSRMLLTLEQRVLKRSLDLVVAIIATIILLPVMIVTAIAVKLDSPGPALYAQVRVGRNGKLFKVHKFRSMRQDAEAISGPVLASENDPRITRLGRFIRATRLDELPQLFDVLAGNMSIVGPRPERPFFVERFIAEKPEYAYRHNVKPGITGLAQIAGKYNTTAYDKLVYDLIYIQNFSVINDLTLMLQTFKVLITKSSTEGVQNNK